MLRRDSFICCQGKSCRKLSSRRTRDIQNKSLYPFLYKRNIQNRSSLEEVIKIILLPSFFFILPNKNKKKRYKRICLIFNSSVSNWIEFIADRELNKFDLISYNFENNKNKNCGQKSLPFVTKRQFQTPDRTTTKKRNFLLKFTVFLLFVLAGNGRI